MRRDCAASGELIGSASNNHQRFVRANLTDDLIFVEAVLEGAAGNPDEVRGRMNALVV